MRHSIHAIAALSCLIFSGCGQFSDSSSQVAVVDLDKAADNLGRNQTFQQSVKAHEQNLNQQLAKAQASYKEQLLAMKSQLGENPTDEQKQQLLERQKQANLQLKQAAQKAKQNLEQYRKNLQVKFHEEAKLAVQQVAHEQGLSLVVKKNDSVVLLYDDAVDITGEVTQQMQTNSQIQTASFQDETFQR